MLVKNLSTIQHKCFFLMFSFLSITDQENLKEIDADADEDEEVIFKIKKDNAHHYINLSMTDFKLKFNNYHINININLLRLSQQHEFIHQL